MTRVLLVDDHPVFLAGLGTLLHANPEVDVVGEAVDGDRAVDLAIRLSPEVVLMDLQMPRGNGIEATRRIRDCRPEIAVLMLTMFDDDGSVFAAMRAGARGYLLKDADSDDIVRAVTVVAGGGAVFGQGVARRLISYFSAAEPHPPADCFPQLTGGERQVLDLIAAGHNNHEIATRLGLSPKTIRNRVSCIFAKLQLRDRSEAIVRGRGAGLGGSALT